MPAVLAAFVAGFCAHVALVDFTLFWRPYAGAGSLVFAVVLLISAAGVVSDIRKGAR